MQLHTDGLQPLVEIPDGKELLDVERLALLRNPGLKCRSQAFYQSGRDVEGLAAKDEFQDHAEELIYE